MFEFKCYWCTEVFNSTSLDVFIFHLKSYHKEKKKYCPIPTCHQISSYFYRLKRHIGTHIKYMEKENHNFRKIEMNKQQSPPQVASTSSAGVMEVSGQDNLPTEATEDLNSRFQKYAHNLTVELRKKFSQEDVQFILDLLKRELLKPMFDNLKDMFRDVEESQLNDKIMQILQLDVDKIIPTPPTQ